MKVVFSEHGWDDYCHWLEADRRTLKRINALIRDIQRHPYEGMGKPEPLRHALSGYWSRRIDAEHRLVYKVEAEALYVVQARRHY